MPIIFPPDASDSMELLLLLQLPKRFELFLVPLESLYWPLVHFYPMERLDMSLRKKTSDSEGRLPRKITTQFWIQWHILPMLSTAWNAAAMKDRQSFFCHDRDQILSNLLSSLLYHSLLIFKEQSSFFSLFLSSSSCIHRLSKLSKRPQFKLLSLCGIYWHSHGSRGGFFVVVFSPWSCCKGSHTPVFKKTKWFKVQCQLNIYEWLVILRTGHV